MTKQFQTLTGTKHVLIHVDEACAQCLSAPGIKRVYFLDADVVLCYPCLDAALNQFPPTEELA